MKVLITGNKGFIGKNIETRLKNRGLDIYGWNRDGIQHKGICAFKYNLLSHEEVRIGLSIIRPDVVVHCAGNSNVKLSFDSPYEDMQDNYITTHNLLFAIKELSIPCRFVLLSSAAVYGNPQKLPISECDDANPLSPYALHKLAAEENCKFMSENYELDAKIVRIFSAYGPGLKKQIFWDMYNKVVSKGKLELWGSGEESRDYIYIDDLTQAIELIITKAPRDELIYNIANGEEVTIRRAAECFSEHMSLPVSKIFFNGIRREGDPINWKADIEKLLSLGYKRKISFELGIKKYIDWVGKNR